QQLTSSVNSALSSPSLIDSRYFVSSVKSNTRQESMSLSPKAITRTQLVLVRGSRIRGKPVATVGGCAPKSIGVAHCNPLSSACSTLETQGRRQTNRKRYSWPILRRPSRTAFQIFLYRATSPTASLLVGGTLRRIT